MKDKRKEEYSDTEIRAIINNIVKHTRKVEDSLKVFESISVDKRKKILEEVLSEGDKRLKKWRKQLSDLQWRCFARTVNSSKDIKQRKQ